MNLEKVALKHYNAAQAKASAYDLITLGELAGAELLTYTLNNSQFLELTKGTTKLSVDKLSLKVVKNQASKFEEKTTLGAGIPDKWRITKPTEVFWNQPMKAYEAYFAVEEQFADKAISTSAKIAKMLNQFANAFERSSFAQLEDKIIEDEKHEKVDLMTLEPKQAWVKVISKAQELTETYDESQGLDGIAPEDIVILAKPKFATHIVSTGLGGNRMDLTFSKGMYSIHEVGGFRMISSTLLKKYDVIITTRFVAAAALKMLAISAGKIDNLSEDKGVYIEGMWASGIIWDNLALGIYSSSSAPTKDTVRKVKFSPDGDLKLQGSTTSEIDGSPVDGAES